jgi:hypothetical protein
MYLIIFLLSTIQLVPASSFTNNKQQDARLGGKVFINYLMPANKGASGVIVGKKYFSDFKVLLIPKTVTVNTSMITINKGSFCANDGALFKRYNVKVAYSNVDGYFEFRGLRPNTHYILIFCDRDVQVSESVTGDKEATFSIGEKQVKL